MVDVNPLDSMKTLLDNEYNTSNTDSVSPTIAKIYTQPKTYNLQRKDYILLYSTSSQLTPVGIGGNTTSDVIENIRIDIRTGPQNHGDRTNDAHARKVLFEVIRILKGNTNNPSNDFCILNPNINYQDLSDGTRQIFRYVIDVTLEDYNRNIT